MKKFLMIAMVLVLGCTAAFGAMAEEVESFPADPDSLVFESTWVNENGAVEIVYEEAGFRVCVTQDSDDTSTRWDYNCLYDKENKRLVSIYSAKLHTALENKFEGTGWIDDYEDLDAALETTFTINSEGKLVWNDAKEDAGKGLTFEKIGMFNGKWACDGAEIEFLWSDDHYAVYAKVAGDDAEWLMNGYYDPKTNTVSAMGTKGDTGKECESVFAFTKDGYLTWHDEKIPEVKDMLFSIN